MIIAITGPAGSGKTTVAGKLAKQLPKCVNIEVDHIKHFIISGFKVETEPYGKKTWLFDQWPLVGDSIGRLAKNFEAHGYDVIINGYMFESGWDELKKHVELSHAFVLLPHPDAAITRDGGRPEETMMGKDAVLDHYKDFSEGDYYQDFQQIDSTEHTADETVELILKQLS